jgi:hypothetical protein
MQILLNLTNSRTSYIYFIYKLHDTNLKKKKSYEVIDENNWIMFHTFAKFSRLSLSHSLVACVANIFNSVCVGGVVMSRNLEKAVLSVHAGSFVKGSQDFIEPK